MSPQIGPEDIPNPAETLPELTPGQKEELFYKLSQRIPTSGVIQRAKDLYERYPKLLDVRYALHDGKTALMAALSIGNFPYAKLLINLGANPTITSFSGKSALDYAASAEYSTNYEDYYDKLKDHFGGYFSKNIEIDEGSRILDDVESDEYKIFEEIYSKHSWHEIGNESKVPLMTSLFLSNKTFLIDFLEEKKFFSSLVQIKIEEKILLIDGMLANREIEASKFFKKVSLTKDEELLVEEILRNDIGDQQYGAARITQIARESANKGEASPADKEELSTILSLVSVLRLRQRRRPSKHPAAGHISHTDTGNSASTTTDPLQNAINFFERSGYNPQVYSKKSIAEKEYSDHDSVTTDDLEGLPVEDNGPMTIDEINHDKEGSGPAPLKPGQIEFTPPEGMSMKDTAKFLGQQFPGCKFETRAMPRDGKADIDHSKEFLKVIKIARNEIEGPPSRSPSTYQRPSEEQKKSWSNKIEELSDKKLSSAINKSLAKDSAAKKDTSYR